MDTKRKTCKVCDSKRVVQINQMILRGDSIAKINKLYGISRTTITKHKRECIAEVLQTALDERGEEKQLVGDTLIKQVEADIGMIHKLINACDEYLTDPEDPNKYFVGPRSNEIEIVYQGKDPQTGRLEKLTHKASLQEMIDVVENSDNFIVRNINIKQADPRELLLKSIAKLEGIVKMILETTMSEIENRHKRDAMDKAQSEGGTISFEKQIDTITERVTIAMRSSNTAELSKIAKLPEL